MKQETIEKAAKELCTTESMPQWEKDYGMFCFMDGARWRISSVWHDAQDGCPPAGDDPYLAVLDIPGFGRKAKIWSGQSNHPFLVKWAYIRDLMDEEEGQ